MAQSSVCIRLKRIETVIASGRFLLLLLIAATRAFAGDVDLAWDPVVSASGYKIYYGPSLGNYPSHIDVGNTTAYAVTGLTEGATYHFVATAYDAAGAESGFSDDASATVAFSAPVAQFSGSPTSGTFPLTVNFSNTSTGSITSYAWTFGDGGTSTSRIAEPRLRRGRRHTRSSLTVTGPGGSNTQTRTQLHLRFHSGAGGAIQRQSDVGHLPADGQLQQHVDGVDHQLRVDLRGRRNQHGGVAEPRLRRGGNIHREPDRHRCGRQQHADSDQLHRCFRGGTRGAVQRQPDLRYVPVDGQLQQHVDGVDHELRLELRRWRDQHVASPSHVYAAAGTYTVGLTVTGPGGSNTQTRTNYISVSTAAPVAQFSGSPTSGTFPLTVNFNNTSTGSITSYAWTFGDGGTSTSASPSHVYAAAGTYTVSLTVTGPGGSNTQTQTNYIVVSAAAPVAQFSGSPTSGTFPLTVNFNNTSTGSITSYAWTFGDGGTSTAASPSHVYAAAGTYTVEPDGHRSGRQQHADSDQLHRCFRGGTRGAVQRQPDVRYVPVDGQLQQHVDGVDHELCLDLRRRWDEHTRVAEPRLCGGGNIHSRPDGHRSGRQQHADAQTNYIVGFRGGAGGAVQRQPDVRSPSR